MWSIKRLRGVALIGALAAGGGCAQAGALGDVLGGVLNPQGGNEAMLQGDVQFVDTNRQYLQVRATNGQMANVRFDNRTQVVYQQRAYPVTALERGDEISLRLQQTQQGELYTDQILVTRSVQEISGVSGGNTSNRQYMQLTGYVGQIDSQRGMFLLRAQDGSSLWVALPYNTSSTNVSRFQRLRTGDSVRVGGYMIANDRLELETFL
jgi:hypothetical protein